MAHAQQTGHQVRISERILGKLRPRTRVVKYLEVHVSLKFEGLGQNFSEY